MGTIISLILYSLYIESARQNHSKKTSIWQCKQRLEWCNFKSVSANGYKQPPQVRTDSSSEPRRRNQSCFYTFGSCTIESVHLCCFKPQLWFSLAAALGNWYATCEAGVILSSTEETRAWRGRRPLQGPTSGEGKSWNSNASESMLWTTLLCCLHEWCMVKYFSLKIANFVILQVKFCFPVKIWLKAIFRHCYR